MPAVENLQNQNSIDVELLATALAEKMPAVWISRSPLCTTDEAKAYARVASDRSWRRFCQDTGLEPVSCGRYECEAVDRAVRREMRESKRRVA